MKEKNALLKIAWAALIALLQVSLVSCGSTKPAQPTSITIVIPEEPPSFNAVISDTGYDALVMHMTMLGLTGIDPDGKIYPALAAELPTVDNGEVVVNDQAKTYGRDLEDA
jgi:ABC-type oligopeptide transport system substrate-binding subunit